MHPLCQYVAQIAIRMDEIFYEYNSLSVINGNRYIGIDNKPIKNYILII